AHVVGEQRTGVGAYLAWGRRPAVTALVGREHVVAGSGERSHLVAPRVRALGEPVEEHHHGIAGRSALVDVELDVVGDTDPAHRHGAHAGRRDCRSARSASTRSITRTVAGSRSPSTVARSRASSARSPTRCSRYEAATSPETDGAAGGGSRWNVSCGIARRRL